MATTTSTTRAVQINHENMYVSQVRGVAPELIFVYEAFPVWHELAKAVEIVAQLEQVSQAARTQFQRYDNTVEPVRYMFLRSVALLRR